MIFDIFSAAGFEDTCEVIVIGNRDDEPISSPR